MPVPLPTGEHLILASTSTSRRAMLTAAAVPFTAQASDADEEAEKARLRAQGADALALARGLARAKALPVSRRAPAALVLGCDQTLALEDGAMVDKARDPADARAILACLSGRDHFLHSAAVLLKDGAPVWHATESARLSVRPLTGAFIDAYVDAEWHAISGCVGCYRVEGPGAQLFSAIEGTHFAIQGLPLLALLDFLRGRGVLQA